MGAHLIDGTFKSDKYPSCPLGKVPLSVKDPTAQGLLWEYAQRRRVVDAEFSDDLEQALRNADYDPDGPNGYVAERWRNAVNEVKSLLLWAKESGHVESFRYDTCKGLDGWNDVNGWWARVVVRELKTSKPHELEIRLDSIKEFTFTIAPVDVDSLPKMPVTPNVEARGVYPKILDFARQVYALTA